MTPARFAHPGLVMLLVAVAAVSTGLVIGSGLAAIVGAGAGVYGLVLWVPRAVDARRLRRPVLTRVRRVMAGKRQRIVLPS
jgi:hypothetical protein